ncbi:TPA: hypothetical protein NGR52_004187 [Vibrio parahaemolyticus]|nr:hypothetical protein [Vibrio parahaemolyticus]
MADLRYMTFYDDHIQIWMRDKVHDTKNALCKRLYFKDHENYDECLKAAIVERDKLFRQARGVEFLAERDGSHLNAANNSRTGVVGVSPFVTVKAGKRKPSISTGYTVTIGRGEDRIRQMFSHKHTDRDSVYEAYRKAVYESYRLRQMPRPSERELRLMYIPINWDRIINEKIERIEAKKAAKLKEEAQ